MRFAFRKLKSGINFSILKAIFMGVDKRNQLRLNIAERIIDRENYSARIIFDLADDEFLQILDIEKKNIGGKNYVVWRTD